MLIRILDIESTGIGDDSEICEVGFCDLIALKPDAAGPVANVGACGSALVKIANPMPFEAQSVHHISDADLQKYGLDFPEAWGIMLTPPYSDVLAPAHDKVDVYCAHNAAFERHLIGPDWTGNAPWICTMKCAIRAWPEMPAFGNQVLRYALRLDLDPKKAMPPHAAAPDCFVTAHILAELLRDHSADTLIEWTEAPTAWPRILFGKHKGSAWADVPAGYLEWMIDKAPESDDDGGWADWRACAQAELQRRRNRRVTSKAR